MAVRIHVLTRGEVLRIRVPEQRKLWSAFFKQPRSGFQPVLKLC